MNDKKTTQEYIQAVFDQYPGLTGIDALRLLADIDEDIARARRSEEQERSMMSTGFDPTAQHKRDLAEKYKNQAEALEYIRSRFDSHKAVEVAMAEYEAAGGVA